MKRFVDTNILIHAVSPSPREAEKRRIAQDLLGRDDLALSVQVLMLPILGEAMVGPVS